MWKKRCGGGVFSTEGETHGQISKVVRAVKRCDVKLEIKIEAGQGESQASDHRAIEIDSRDRYMHAEARPGARKERDFF